MDFKKLLAALGFATCAVLVGCGGVVSDHEDEYGIGNKLTAVSTLSTASSSGAQNVVIFDKTVRRIHQFDLLNMQHMRSFEVRNPSLDHTVLYGKDGNYVVDLSLKGLSIFNKYNQANHQPIRFQGKPKSAAFDQASGTLVVYDDLMSVGILKLDANGEVLKSWVGGAVVSGNQTIASGDVNAAGQLILALSDASIVVVDIDQTLLQAKWVYTRFTTSLSDIRWLAPSRQNSQQVLVRTASKIALIDLNTQAVISSYDIVDQVVKVSKFNDPHVLLRSGSQLKIAYVDAQQVQVKTLYVQASGMWSVESVLSSNLDLVQNTWSMVDTKRPVTNIFNDLEEIKTERRFKRYRFNDLLATDNKEIPSETQVELAPNFIFALFPNKLGYAVRYDITTDAKADVRAFNLKYIPAD